MSASVFDGIDAYLRKEKVNRLTARKVARLAGYMNEENKLTKPEIARWKSLAIMNDKGQIGMEDPQSGIEWILLALIYEGKVERVN